MPETNPYAPPAARPEPRPRPGRRRPLATLARVAAVVAGFSLLADSSHLAPNPTLPAGRVAAKALGAVLLAVAFFPVGRRRGGPALEDDRPMEDL